MVLDQKNVSKLFSVLSNDMRRKIILLLNEKSELSFTDLMHNLEVNTGILSFHMRKLQNFLEQTPSGKYCLNRLGNKTLAIIKDGEYLSIESDIVKKVTNFPLARFSKRVIAFLIDSAVAFTITIATTIVTDISSLISGTYSIEVNVLLFLTLFWLYSTLMEGFDGQTLGKALLGLKVVNTLGKKLFYDYAAVRNFGKCFLLPIDLLIGLRIDDERYIRYFDKFSATTVITLRE